MEDSTTTGRSTRLVHSGEPPHEPGAPVNTPVHLSAMYGESGDAGYHDIRYIRLNNTPNHAALAAKLAALEGAEDALVTASGMAAISCSLLAVLRSGDHLLAQGTLYGGTHGLLTTELERMGIAVDFVDDPTPERLGAHRRDNTRAVYVETLSNPLLQLPDLPGIAAWAGREGLVSMVDNTAASPWGFAAASSGYDLSLHSATKYLNGHSDIVAGAVVGRAELVAEAKHRLDHLGGSLDPHACFLLQRGMKTLGLRIERQAANALSLARTLEEQPGVARVHYPGLVSHPDHARAQELLRCHGGLFSFELVGGEPAARRMVAALRLPRHAPSFGGVESLVTLPAGSSHKGMPAEERRARGIADGLVRVSVGIEDERDLHDDFLQALAAAQGAA